jgi:hypothetical protein
VGIPGTNPKHSIYNINCTIGVSTVVYCGIEALQIPPCIIGELRGRADDSGEVHQEKPNTGFPGRHGDLIKFKETSPLFGFLAEIKSVDKGGKLMVELDKMLGTGRQVAVSVSDVGAIIHRVKPPRPSRAYHAEKRFLRNGGSLCRGGDNGL